MGRQSSLDASVRIEGADRAGLERLLRYCARPPFALERLEKLGDDRLAYRMCFAHPSEHVIREGVEQLAQVCRREFGMPTTRAGEHR
jgi:hypothetical protein